MGILVKILKEHVDAQLVFDCCIRKGMMIRNCSSFPFLDSRYIRFCVMQPEQNARLLETMGEML